MPVDRGQGSAGTADHFTTPASNVQVTPQNGISSENVQDALEELAADDLATPITIANGGTGAATASTARSNLGLGDIAVETSPLAVAKGGTGSATASAARTALGLGDIAVETAPLAVAKGGTGAATAANARSNLGVNFRGALVYLSAAGGDFAVPNNTNTPVIWDAEEYDTDSFHDLVTNPTRITIPSGVSVVRFVAHVNWDGQATGWHTMWLVKNGVDTDTPPGCFRIIAENTDAVDHTQDGVSAPLQVTAGDYFELYVFQNSGLADSLDATGSATDVRNWFSIEVLE